MYRLRRSLSALDEDNRRKCVLLTLEATHRDEWVMGRLAELRRLHRSITSNDNNNDQQQQKQHNVKRQKHR
jgi:hypothetical protein